ncbi:MAG: 1-acyl-sn-glycerol-3-phosphate acyltransferase [Prevotellaceae bacterium]|nr:1-acyl-sn-glycerol-3-phosphate acyltransferase [Prevotellaceae bacterium]
MEAYLIIKKYLEEEKLSFDSLDSLDRVSLQCFIAQSFGVEVNAVSVGDFPSLEALAEYVDRRKTRTEPRRVNWHELLALSLPIELPSSTVFFPLASKLLRLWLGLYHRLSIRGRENIPKAGPFILAPNHQSFLDGAAVMSGIRWAGVKHFYFFATEDHVRTPLVRFMARHSNVVVMERQNLKDSIHRLAEVLRQGQNLIIFPEGSRTHTGELGQFKRTYAIMSLELGVPVVPVCIRGAFEAWPRKRRIARPGKVTVEYLPPVIPHRSSSYEQLNAEVRTAILQRLRGASPLSRDKGV